VSHSHLPIKHLLKKIETAGPRTRRDVRPQWITALIEQIAELFEPFTDVGRVGFDCKAAADRWEVGLYLGTTELVGGRCDGEMLHVDFQFDLMQFNRLFDQIDRFHWNAFPADVNQAALECSFVVLDGRYQDNPVRVRIFCVPPTEAGPGLRHRTDGTWETV